METGVRSHQGELFVHPLSNPGAAGICPEMLEVAEEASRAGDFDLAAEIYSSQLADLQHPDRGLCLRKADSLARAGRISEALDSYCIAASLGKLRPDELPLLVETIARTLREKELGIPGTLNGQVKSSNGGDGVESDVECGEDETLDLFSCRLCKCLLNEPTTVECGHTYCKRCLEDDSVKDCIQCKQKLYKKDELPNGRRLNVVLSGLLDKLFATESKARKFCIEGEILWEKQNLTDALEKYNAAVDLGKKGHHSCMQRKRYNAKRFHQKFFVQVTYFSLCSFPVSPIVGATLTFLGCTEVSRYVMVIFCLPMTQSYPGFYLYSAVL